MATADIGALLLPAVDADAGRAPAWVGRAGYV